jgi:hypothetical protein
LCSAIRNILNILIKFINTSKSFKMLKKRWISVKKVRIFDFAIFFCETITVLNHLWGSFFKKSPEIIIHEPISQQLVVFLKELYLKNYICIKKFIFIQKRKRKVHTWIEQTFHMQNANEKELNQFDTFFFVCLHYP